MQPFPQIFVYFMHVIKMCDSQYGYVQLTSLNEIKANIAKQLINQSIKQSINLLINQLKLTLKQTKQS